jgi:DNA modification methylase
MKLPYKLYNDDYLNVIKNIEDASVDLILTDIPYNISRDSGLGGYDKKNNRNRTGLDFGEWDKGLGINVFNPLISNPLSHSPKSRPVLFLLFFLSYPPNPLSLLML